MDVEYMGESKSFNMKPPHTFQNAVINKSACKLQVEVLMVTLCYLSMVRINWLESP